MHHADKLLMMNKNWKNIMLISVVCAAVVVAHLKSLSAKAWSMDDNEYLRRNQLVQNPGWDSAKRFITEVTEPSTVRGYYQPLTMLSLMADCAMGGGPNKLIVLHRTSLILHVANTALMVVIFYMLFGNIYAAVLAGLVFGVHPISVESVAWVAERKTVLATFFALASMALYLKYCKVNSMDYYPLFLVTYICAMLSKPTAIALPVLFLLLDIWPLKRFDRKTFFEKVPLFLVMTIFAGVTLVSQARTGFVISPIRHTFTGIILTICHNIIFYIQKWFVPAWLSVFYPIEKITLHNPAILAGVIGTVLLIILLVLSWRWTKAFVIGFLIFFVAVFPTMGIIGFTDVIVANRFVYLPSFGFLLILCWLLSRLLERADIRKNVKYCVICLILLFISMEIYMTRRYAGHWQDSVSHFKYEMSLSPNSEKINYNYGLALEEAGNEKQAIHYFKRAVEINPQYHQAHNNLGAMYAQKGDLDNALIHFSKAIEYNPDSDRAYHNYAQACFFKGRYAEAIEHYERAVELKPDNPSTLTGLAWVYATAQDKKYRNSAKAIMLAERACKITDYRRADSVSALAAAYAEHEDFENAVMFQQMAVDIYLKENQFQRAEKARNKLKIYKIKNQL